jgi:hypothetical protein
VNDTDRRAARLRHVATWLARVSAVCLAAMFILEIGWAGRPAVDNTAAGLVLAAAAIYAVSLWLRDRAVRIVMDETISKIGTRSTDTQEDPCG